MGNPRNKEIRHYILIALEHSYPYGASERLIRLTLDGLSLNVSPGELQAHLTYLKQKGYLTKEKVEDEATMISRNIVKLTAKGKDLREGNIPKDPGIGLNQE